MCILHYFLVTTGLKILLGAVRAIFLPNVHPLTNVDKKDTQQAIPEHVSVKSLVHFEK